MVYDDSAWRLIEYHGMNTAKPRLSWEEFERLLKPRHELDSLRYVAESAAEQLRVAEEREHSIFTQRNEGSSTSFYSCGICGASVQPMDRETHFEWHQL